MEGVGSAAPTSAKREDSEAKDSSADLLMEAPVKDLNLQFYQGKIISEPHGVTVDEILSWYGDTYMLETYHGYIQWLFPTSQPSSGNRYAQPLQPGEAEAIQQDKMARKRFLTAYLMMLDFYGMTIVDFGTGTLSRTQYYKDRLVNLNFSTHNHIRITRIIRSLGEMGLERYQFPLVKHLLMEVIWSWRLLDALTSALDFWIEAVKDATERNILKDYAVKLAKGVLDSVAPHATKGKVPCNCQTCASLQEMRKLAPDYQPKALVPGDPQLKPQTVCGDAMCSSCRNKVYISNDRDQLAAQRVVLIEDLSHLTLELGKISASLNVVAADRAHQKTIETPAQIEELACLMDELKQVSIALGLVSTKLETLSLGERIIQKNESEMAAKQLAAQSVKACTEEDPCSAVVQSVHDPTPGSKGEKAEAFREGSEETAAGFILDSPHTILDRERKVERANNTLAQQRFSPTAEGNTVLERASTIKGGSRTDNQDYSQHKKERSVAGKSILGAKENRQLSKELAKKEDLQISPETNPGRIEKDPIILTTGGLFSEFNSSLDPHESDEVSRKENYSTATGVFSRGDLSFTEARREGVGDFSEKSWTFVEMDGADEEAKLSTFGKQRPLENFQGSSWSDQNMPGSENKGDRERSIRGKKEQENTTKEIRLNEDWELNEDKYALPLDDDQESEEAFEELSWMKDFRERSSRAKEVHN